MTLEKYLKSEGIRATHFAPKIGVSPSAVTRLINGQREPSAEVIRRIAEVTGGKVMPNDMIPIPAVSPEQTTDAADSVHRAAE